MHSSKCDIHNQRDVTPCPDHTARSHFEKKAAKSRYDKGSDKQGWMVLKRILVSPLKDYLCFAYRKVSSLYEQSDGLGDKKFEVRSGEGKYSCKWIFRGNIEKKFLTIIVAPQFSGLLFKDDESPLISMNSFHYYLQLSLFTHTQAKCKKG